MSQNPKSRFYAYSEEELAALPPQPILVPNAIRRGDLVVVAGNREFAVSLRQVFGQDARLLTVAENFTSANRAELFRRIEEIRQAGDGPAVIVHLASATGALFDWIAPLADAVLVATAADRAQVTALRDFREPEPNQRLVIRDGVARVVRA